MKKTSLIFSSAAALFLLNKKRKAWQRKQSLPSLLIEEFLQKNSMLINLSREWKDLRALENGNRPYHLPRGIQNFYQVAWDPALKETVTFGAEQPAFWIYYLHGGAYWNQPLGIHYSFLHRLANQLNAKIVMPLYPKSPDFHAVDAIRMVAGNYSAFLKKHRADPKKVLLMGDSAGGGLALSLLQILRAEKKPLPLMTFLFSPWLDVSDSNPEMKKLQQDDPLLELANLSFRGEWYAGDLSTKDPLISPRYADFSNLPPVDIFFGTHDLLYADAEKLQQEARQHPDWPLTFHIFENMDHIFSLYPIPEAEETIAIVRDRLLQCEEGVSHRTEK